MNVLPHLQVEVKISQTTTLPLATHGIGSPRFANPSEPRNQASAFRIAEQIRLNRGENLDSIGFGEFMKPSGKRQRFNEYHSVIVPHCGSTMEVLDGLLKQAGCSVSGAGRTTRNRTALPHPSSSRRFRSTQPATCYPRAKLKVMMPARCPVSPLLDIQRFRKRSLSMLSAEVAGGAANGSFDAISTRASPHFTRQSKLS